jgi:hypothetical protein
MAEEIAAMGDVITGGVLASVVEPVHDEAQSANNGTCGNCQTALLGKHCHHCGQSAHIHRTLSAFGHDFLHSIFHFEGKIWRTIPMLVLQPGGLTRRYIHGQRARFVSPLALFLFFVFLMFAVFGLTGGPFQLNSSVTQNGVVTNEAELRGQLSTAKQTLATLIKEREATAEEKRVVIEKRISVLQKEIKGLTLGADVAAGNVNLETALSDFKVKTSSPKIDAALNHAIDNPALTIYRIQSAAYKFSWALIPISLPFLWILFAWRREYKLYDHAVFITYSLSFMFLLVIVLALVRTAGLSGAWIAIPLLVFPPLHMYWQFKVGYELTRNGALWRTALMTVFAAICLIMFAILLLILGLSG